MAFDPAFPAENGLLVSAEFRAQFNALADLVAGLEARVTALEAAVAGTARNPNSVTLSIALSDPPTQSQVQQIVDTLNALSSDLRRD